MIVSRAVSKFRVVVLEGRKFETESVLIKLPFSSLDVFDQIPTY